MNDYREKWAFLQRAPIADALTSEVRSIAASVCLIAARAACPTWAKAQLCQCIARDMVAYMPDKARVGREQIDGFTDPLGLATAALIRGVDDCDAKGRLCVALCLACGLRAEMQPLPTETEIAHGAELTHVYGRVWLPERHTEPASAAHPEGRAYENADKWAWYPVETILARASIGSLPMATPKETSGIHAGEWLYS